MADSVAAIVAGMRMPEMRAFVEKHLAGRGAGAASPLIGLDRQAHPTDAARGGEVFTRTSEHMRGEAERPHASGALEAKFVNLTESTWPRAKAEAVLADLMRLEEVGSVTEPSSRHGI